jgi:hypothetical protein
MHKNYDVVFKSIYGGVHKIEYNDKTEEINLKYHLITNFIKINDLVNIQQLYLGCNQIDHLSSQIGSLTNLRVLDLSDNRIQKIENLNRLTNLRVLNLKCNHITVMEGMENLSNLEELNLNINQIKKIEGLENQINLRDLALGRNRIERIESLDNLENLQKLDLGSNQISRIDGLNCLKNLRELDLCGNLIKKIENITNLHQLQTLDLDRNLIGSIEGLDQLVQLISLDMRANNIKRIEGLDGQSALIKLHLDNNQIRAIEGLDGLTSIQDLWLHNNPIDVIPMTIMHLRNLTFLSVDPPINPIFQRFLSRNLLKSNRTIFDDRQNVHDQHINNHITKSLYGLMEEKTTKTEEQTVQEIIIDPILSETTKEAILEYIKISDVHSILNVTFMEALHCIWQIIMNHENSKDIRQIMDQEMQDSLCKCFTGRMSRLVNCLNGYDSRVVITISDSQEIANVIVAVRNRKRKRNDMDDKDLIISELTKRGYTRKTIDEWTEYLD